MTTGPSTQEVERAVAEAWLRGQPMEPVSLKYGLAIGIIGEIVVNLGLRLRDHKMRPLDRIAMREDLRMA